VTDTPWWLQDEDEAPDPLSAAQVEELYADLLALREALTAELAAPSDREATVDLDQPIGRVSRVDALQQQKMAQAQRTRQRARLGQVAVAVRAYADGEYGDCRACGEAIGYDRLKAKPESPLCVSCAASSERR